MLHAPDCLVLEVVVRRDVRQDHPVVVAVFFTVRFLAGKNGQQQKREKESHVLENHDGHNKVLDVYMTILQKK